MEIKEAEVRKDPHHRLQLWVEALLTTVEPGSGLSGAEFMPTLPGWF